MATTTSEQKLVPTLHHLTSAQSHRVLFMLEELQEKYGTQYKLNVHERTSKVTATELKKSFPLGKSPILTLEEDGKPSTKIYQLRQYPGTLTESRLILQFLADTFSKGEWIPESPEDKAQDTFLQEFANATLAAKCVMALIFEVIAAQFPVGLKQLIGAAFRPIVSHFMTDLEPIFQLLEGTLTEEKPWFSGKTMGMADFNVVWGIDVAVQRKYLDTRKFPKLGAWHEKITSRPAYVRACEKGGVYDLKNFR